MLEGSIHDQNRVIPGQVTTTRRGCCVKVYCGTDPEAMVVVEWLFATILSFIFLVLWRGQENIHNIIAGGGLYMGSWPKAMVYGQRWRQLEEEVKKGTWTEKAVERFHLKDQRRPFSVTV